MKHHLIFITLGSILVSSCANFFDNDIELKHIVGFETEPTIKIEHKMQFYDRLNNLKKQEGIRFQEISYLASLLNIRNGSAKYRFKGAFQYSNVSISANSISLNAANGLSIHHASPEEVYLINNIKNKHSLKLFNATPKDICSISMILYQDNKATYLTTEDSFGIYLGNEDTMKVCQENVNNEISLINPLPIGIKDKDIEKAGKLAHLLNNIKQNHQLSNSEISKMIAMSNINVGIKELTYAEPYVTNNLIISHNSYQLVGDSENNEVNIAHDSSPMLIIFSTNQKNETTLLGRAELAKHNDLKLIIYKKGSSYVYDINNMKRRNIVESQRI